jgi:hypothetical protein
VTYDGETECFALPAEQAMALAQDDALPSCPAPFSSPLP